MTKHNRSEQLRAVFLAALMVVSVFGATVAFSGTAAAASGLSNTSVTATGETHDKIQQDVSESITVTYTIDDLAEDGSEDTSTIKLPESGFTVESIQSATVKDADGVDVSNTNSIVNSGLGTDNAIQVSFTDDGTDSNGTEAHTVTVEATVNSGASEGNYDVKADVTDSNGNDVSNTKVGTLTVDATPPSVNTITTLDRDGDGSVDAAEIVFSEPIDDSTVAPADYTIGGNTAASVDTGSSTDDNTVQVRLALDNQVTGTDAKDVTYTSGTTADLAGNTLADVTSGDVTEDDGAGPVVNSITTLDRDEDGSVDAAEIVFSEPIDDSTVAPADYTIGGNTAASVDTGSSTDDNTVQVRLALDNQVTGTDAKDVTYTSGTTADLAGNTLADVTSGDVTEDDGAGPVATTFTTSLTGDNSEVKVSVDLSESIDSASGGALDVEVAKPDGTSVTHSLGGDFSSPGSSFSATTLTNWNGTYTATITTLTDNNGNTGPSQDETSSVVLGNARDASITASPSGEGETSTHNVTWTVASDTSVDTYEVDYPSADISSVDADSIVKFGIDTDGDGAVETDLSGEVDSIGPNSGDNTLLTVDTSSTTTISDGDRVILEYSDAVNPGGSEDVALRLDPDTGDVDVTRNLAIDVGVAPTVTDITISGTSVKTGDLFGEEVNGTGQTLAVQFSKDMDTSDQPNVTLTVDGQDVTVSDGAFAEGDASLWEGTVDVDVDNSEVDASVSVSEATGTEGNSLSSVSNTFEIDTAPLGIMAAITGEENQDADSDVVYVTLNDTYQNADGDDFTVTGDDENDITYVAEGYGNPDQIELDLDTPQPANETPTVTLNDNGITDDAGNGVSSTTQQVEAIDGVAPDITEFSDSVSTDTITFTVVADEPLNTSAIEVELADGTTTIVTGFSAVEGVNTYEATSSKVPDDDQYTATLTAAEDEAGNDYTDDGTAEKTTQPDVDTSGPTFELVKPADDPTQENSEIDVEIDDQTGVNTSSIYVTVEDADGVIYDRARAEVTDSISFDGDVGDDGATADDISIDGLSLVDGQVNVTVEAKDDNGYSNSAKFTYEVDTQVNDGEVVAPSEPVYKPTDGTLQVKYNYVDSNVDVVDVKLVDEDDGGEQTVTYDINDADYVDDGTNKTVTLDLASKDIIVGDTDYRVDVKVSDALGNTETYSTNGEYVVIDDTAPTTSDFGAVDNTDPQTDFSFDILDDDSTDSGVDASTIELEVNQSSSTLFEGTVSHSAVTFDSNTLTFDTAKAGIEYADNEPVTVNVTVSDNVGNTLNTSADDNPVGSFTVNDVDPVIDSVEAEAGTDTVVVNFNEGVYTNADGTGAVDATDFAYQSGNGGATAIDSVTHSEGDSSATLHLDAAVTASDIGSDLVSVNENAVYDLNAVAVDHSVTHALADSTDPAEPVLTTDGNVTAQNEDEYKVTVTGDTESTANIAVKNSSGVIFKEKTDVDVTSGSADVNFDLTNLEEGDVTIEAEVIDRGVDRRNSTSTMVTKDNTSATMTVRANAGTSYLYVDFSEQVTGVNSINDFNYENLSADKLHGEEDSDKLYVIELDEPVQPSDIGNDSVSVSATTDIADVTGTWASTNEVTLTDDVAPTIDSASADNGSTSVEVRFGEMVYNSSGDALTVDDFTYIDGDGVDHKITGVTHDAGAMMATLELNSSIVADDLAALGDSNPDAIEVTLNDSEDNQNVDAWQPITDDVSIRDIQVKDLSDQNVQIYFNSTEELENFTAHLDSEYYAVEESNVDETFHIGDAEVTETDGVYTYTVDYTVPRDGKFNLELANIETLAGTSYDPGYEYGDDADVVIDYEDPKPIDAELVDANSHYRFDVKFIGDRANSIVAVQFSEPVHEIDDSNLDNITVDGETPFDVRPGRNENEVAVLFSNVVDTGDYQEIAFGEETLVEMFGDRTSVAGTSEVVDTHEYHLEEGVNFVSIPAEYGTLDIASSDFSGLTIMTYDEGEWLTYNPDKPADEQDFEKMEGGQGYVVKTDSAETVHVNVRNEDPGDTAQSANPGQQHLEEGWNLVGHWQENSQYKDNALDTVDSVSRATHIWGQKDAGTFSYMPVDFFAPGEAYWVFVEDDEVYTAAEYGGDA